MSDVKAKKCAIPCQTEKVCVSDFNLATLACHEVACVAVPGGRVHVLIADSSTPLPDSLINLLSDDERARHHSLVIPADADHYSRSHLSMRLLLADFLGAAMEDISIHTKLCLTCGQRHGKPHVTQHDVSVSLSHSTPWIMVGVSDHEIGVDIETFPSLETARSVLNHFHPAERAFLHEINPFSVGQFTRLWCHKEAYLKGLGVGLTRDLSADDLTQDPHNWQIVDVALPVRRVAAAAAVCLKPLVRRELPHESPSTL